MQTRHTAKQQLRAAAVPGFLVLVLMWMVYWADFLFISDFQRYGLQAQTVLGLRGILLMPWIHAHNDIKHILNNSLPTFLLLTLLFQSYKEIAWRVFIYAWLLTGALLWLIGGTNGAIHIGMSGVIYALAAFLFTSGVLRKYLPLQALSLFIVFLYGSMIWGIFPTQPRVSWQGHLSGLIIGVFLAFIYRKQGPQRPKYQYEIEKELGIEPPDFEGDLRRAIEAEAARQLAEEAQPLAIETERSPQASSSSEQVPTIVVYDYKKND
jgi:membrane associated rhomboid family serine protease